jgi:transcriptional regulator with XRE-family HTH domain
MPKSIYSQKRDFISARLIQAREESGLTQSQIAETKIISQSELSKIENGQRRVEFLVLLDLAKLYSKPIEFFIPPE